MNGDAASNRSAGMLGIFPAAAIGLLPKLTCPVCWPAYTAVLSGLGVGFVDYTPYLLPLTALFVAVSIGAFALTARARRNFLPLLVGVPAGAVLLFGKFALDSDILAYAGIGLLVIAPFLRWRRRDQASCSQCAPLPKEEIAP
jgi:hypothetical protein